MAGSLFDWSTTAADNDDADTDINWLEGQAGQTVNNSARAMMAKIAGLIRALKGSYTTGGSSTTYTLTVDFPPSSLATKGWFGLVRFHTANGATPSIDINSLGAVAIYMNDGAAPAVGELATNSVHLVHYDTATSRLRVVTAGATTSLTSADISDFNAAVAAIILTTDELTANTSPAVDDFLKTYDTSATAERKMTFENFLKVINLLTSDTSPDTADSIATYDASASTVKNVTLNNLLKVINTFTAETAVAVDDVVGLYDTSAATMDKATVQNVLKAINGLTEDTSPDKSADFVLTYDTSASDVKKAKPSNLGGGMTLLGTITTTSGASQSLSGLDLSGYKMLKLWLKGVSLTTSPAHILIGNSTADDVQFVPANSASASEVYNMVVDIDLADGWSMAIGRATNNSAQGSFSNTSSELGYMADTPLSTSSTTISVAPNTGNFDAGSIKVWGIA